MGSEQDIAEGDGTWEEGDEDHELLEVPTELLMLHLDIESKGLTASEFKEAINGD